MEMRHDISPNAAPHLWNMARYLPEWCTTFGECGITSMEMRQDIYPDGVPPLGEYGTTFTGIWHNISRKVYHL
jgi:hypothetical protein